MAKYNTFTVQFTKNGRLLLVTSSARKAKQMLSPGLLLRGDGYDTPFYMKD